MLSVQANCIHSVADRGACGAEDIVYRRDDQMMMYSLYGYFSIDRRRGQEGCLGAWRDKRVKKRTVRVR